MDLTVLFKLTYGMYIVGAMDEARPAGCVINTCFQVTSSNPLLTVSLNKKTSHSTSLKKRVVSRCRYCQKTVIRC